jgi:hypothetical protein
LEANTKNYRNIGSKVSTIEQVSEKSQSNINGLQEIGFDYKDDQKGIFCEKSLSSTYNDYYTDRELRYQTELDGKSCTTMQNWLLKGRNRYKRVLGSIGRKD